MRALSYLCFHSTLVLFRCSVVLACVMEYYLGTGASYHGRSRGTSGTLLRSGASFHREVPYRQWRRNGSSILLLLLGICPLWNIPMLLVCTSRPNTSLGVLSGGLGHPALGDHRAACLFHSSYFCPPPKVLLPFFWSLEMQTILFHPFTLKVKLQGCLRSSVG